MDKVDKIDLNGIHKLSTLNVPGWARYGLNIAIEYPWFGILDIDNINLWLLSLAYSSN